MATEPQHAESNRDRRDEQDRYQLDRRLTILETRFGTILPMLATKADLAELKAEIGGLSRSMGTLFITTILGFAGMIVTMISLLRH
jgi:tRNA U34 5-methylaminomethyl-2-thiouridine-forming methyltransferase MnmC